MCGIFAAYNECNPEIAREIFFALMALQHRGQEAAGIAVSDKKVINYKKDSGMVNQIFRESHLQALPGNFGIGHTRYATVGNPDAGRQPYQFSSKLGPFAFAHNGEIVGHVAAKQKLIDQGVCFFTDSDSELLAHYIARSDKDCWKNVLADVIEQVPGAYSLVILTNEEVWAIRDPLGLRLLCWGRGPSGLYIASESCCFNVLGAEYIGEIPPGHVARIGCDGFSMVAIKQYPQKTCAFEHVYFARPDSNIGGKYVSTIRQNIGQELAAQTAGKFSSEYVVAGVPESANPMAVGYSTASGIPYTEIFAKNRYIHRTFIKPVNSERKSAVYLKFNPLVDNIRGKKIILIDDSIVRGNTIKHLVQMLKGVGAEQVHVLVGCPEIHYPCYMGVDMKEKSEFIMNNISAADLAQNIGADTVTFLELDRLISAIGNDKLCTACWTGVYPKELDW